MTEEKFINEVILPEAARLDLKIKADLYHAFDDGHRTFAITFEFNGRRGASPMGFNSEEMQDIEKGKALAGYYLSNLKQFLTTGVAPEGCSTHYGRHRKAA